RKSLYEFRMDWTSLSAKSDASPGLDELAALIQRAKDFIVGVQAMVLQETNDWVAEFQKSTAQLDKEVGARLDALQSQVEKAVKAQAAIAQPVSIELSVPNTHKTHRFAFEASIEGSQGKIAEERISNTKKWVKLNVAPGQYRVLVSTMVSGKPTSAAAAVIVKPEEVTRFEIPLP